MRTIEKEAMNIVSVKSESGIAAFALAVLGSLFALVGTAALSAQLLTPTTFIGAVNYITVGTIILFTNSKTAQEKAYSYVPRRVKSVLFES
jgi:hypothetical protein